MQFSEFRANTTPCLSIFEGGITNTAVTRVGGGWKDIVALHRGAAAVTAQARAALASARAAEESGDTESAARFYSDYDRAKKTLPYITAARFDPPARGKVNVIGADALIVDIDTAPADETPETLRSKATAAGVPPIYAGRTGKGFRLYYALEQPITGPNTGSVYRAVYDGLMATLSAGGVEADPALNKPEQAALVWYDEAAVWDFRAPALKLPPPDSVATPDPAPSALPPEGPKAPLIVDEYTAPFADPAADLTPLRDNQKLRAMFTYAWARTFNEAGRQSLVSLITRARGGQFTEAVLIDKANRAFSYGLKRPDYFATRLDAYSFIRSVAERCNVRLPIHPYPPAGVVLECDRYLSEIQAEIETALTGQRVLIQAPTGTGKTTFVIDYCSRKVKYFTENQIGLIVTPRTILASDLAKRAHAAGVIAGDAKEGVRARQIAVDLAQGCRLFGCTADALPKFWKNNVECKLLIVDEAHDIIAAAGFRGKAMSLLQEQIRMTLAGGGQVIFLTATPPRPLFDALKIDTFIRVRRRNGPEYSFTPVNATTPYLLDYIQANADRVGILEINLKGRTLRGVYPYVERLRQLGVDAYAVTRDSVDNLDAFRRAVQTNGRGWLVTTCVAEMGLDIDADGKDCIVIHQIEQSDFHPTTLAQMAGRLRNARKVKLQTWLGGEAAIYTPADRRRPVRPVARLSEVEKDVLSQQAHLERVISDLVKLPKDDLDLPPDTTVPPGSFTSVYAGIESLQRNNFEAAREMQNIIAKVGGLDEYTADLRRYIGNLEVNPVLSWAELSAAEDDIPDFAWAASIIDNTLEIVPETELLPFIAGWCKTFDFSGGARRGGDDQYARFVEPSDPVTEVQRLFGVWLKGQAAVLAEKAANQTRACNRKRTLNKIAQLTAQVSEFQANERLCRRYLDAKVAWAAAVYDNILALPKAATLNDAYSTLNAVRSLGVTAARFAAAALRFFVWQAEGGAAPSEPADRIWAEAAVRVWEQRATLTKIIESITPIQPDRAEPADDDPPLPEHTGVIGTRRQRYAVCQAVRRLALMPTARRCDCENWLNLVFMFLPSIDTIPIPPKVPQPSDGATESDTVPNAQIKQTDERQVYGYEFKIQRQGLADWGLSDLEQRLRAKTPPADRIIYVPPAPAAEVANMTVSPPTLPPPPTSDPLPVLPPPPTPDPLPVLPPPDESEYPDLPAPTLPPTEVAVPPIPVGLVSDPAEPDVLYRRIESIPKKGHDNFVELIECTGKRYTVKASPCIGPEIRIYERYYPPESVGALDIVPPPDEDDFDY